MRVDLLKGCSVKVVASGNSISSDCSVGASGTRSSVSGLSSGSRSSAFSMASAGRFTGFSYNNL